MAYALQTAATGMRAQETKINVISNNLANISTNAFKKKQAHFEDLMYLNEKRAGANATDSQTKPPTGIQVGLGVKTGAVYTINEQGQPRQTHDNLHIHINGKGHFRVERPDGSFAYTRDGAFGRNEEGEIVDKHGHLVSPGFTIPAEAQSIDINSSGEIHIKLAGELEPQLLGQIPLYNFINVGGLEDIGDNLKLVTDVSGDAIEGIPNSEEFGKLMQGWVENSNVNPVFEITELITTQRGYELNSQVIKAYDEILQAINNMKR